MTNIRNIVEKRVERIKRNYSSTELKSIENPNKIVLHCNLHDFTWNSTYEQLKFRSKKGRTSCPECWKNRKNSKIRNFAINRFEILANSEEEFIRGMLSIHSNLRFEKHEKNFLVFRCDSCSKIFEIPEFERKFFYVKCNSCKNNEPFRRKIFLHTIEMLNPNFDIREERNFLELSCRKCRNEKIRIAIRKRKNLKFFCRNCEKEDSKKEIENLFGQFSSNSENFEKYRITPENFSKKLQLARKKICEENYELLSVEGHRLILKCPKHGIFRPWLYDFLFRNTKCPECQNEKRKNTVEKYNEVLKKFDIEIVFPKSDEKIGTKSPVLFHCRKHHVFFTSSLLYVTRRRYKCPECRRTEFTSSGWENEVAEFVSSLKIEISRNCRIFGNFEIDILVKNSRIAIECNGLYFHSSKFLPKNYHVNKTEQLERRNYRLIHIFEDEWKFHRNAVRNVLKYVLNRAEKGVPARKITSIRKISFSMARNFHEKHSLQKAIRSTFHYGAFFNDELVACMSFSKRRNFENSWKMTGFCTNGKCHAGLFSRMLKHFEKENRPLSITANVDRRWFTGSTLKKNGFVLVKITEPRRWYVHENRRSTENSQKKNLSKIYDCGTLVFVKNFS